MVHFNWTQLIPSVGHHYIHVATAVATTAVLGILSLFAYASLKKSKSANYAPSASFSVRGLFEVLTELVVYLSDSMMGPEKRKYIPLFGCVFFYILFNNLMGLLPGMTPATDNINTNLAVGLFVFIAYNALGVKEHGMAYFKHFLGPILVLAPLMLPIELISHAVRPVSLSLRLMGNMTGDHTVLGIFLDLVPIGVPVIFYVLGLFVCFVQAFVFTLLTMVYVSMAMAHDH